MRSSPEDRTDPAREPISGLTTQPIHLADATTNGMGQQATRSPPLANGVKTERQKQSGGDRSATVVRRCATVPAPIQPAIRAVCLRKSPASHQLSSDHNTKSVAGTFEVRRQCNEIRVAAEKQCVNVTDFIMLCAREKAERGRIKTFLASVRKVSFLE